MGLDIRIPIGATFAVIGSLLAVYDLAAARSARTYEQSLSINANLWWGAVMLVFSLAMHYLGRRGGDATVHLAEESAEGRAMEVREHHAEKDIKPEHEIKNGAKRRSTF
jgi:hypothetical protein